MISVVIPTYNNTALLRAHLDRYKSQSLSKKLFEVIVVNDGGDTVDYDSKGGFDYTEFELEENGGPAKARNFGASKADFDRVLFVGDDCYPTQDLLLRHALHHRLYPNIALQGFSPFHPDVMDTRFMHWLDKSGMQASWQNLKNKDGWRKEVDGYLLTTNWSIGKGDFLRLGGFEESFPSAAWEDVAFGHTLRRNSYKTYFDPAAINMHYHKHTISSFIARSKREGLSRVVLCYVYPEFANTLLSPKDLRGVIETDLDELAAQAGKLQNIPQANIEELLRTLMVGNAMKSAYDSMLETGGVLRALPYLHNGEYPAYVFSCWKGIKEGNDGFVRHCIEWGKLKERSNWATYGFAGEAYLALEDKAQAYLEFKKAMEMMTKNNGQVNEWIVNRVEELERDLNE